MTERRLHFRQRTCAPAQQWEKCGFGKPRPRPRPRRRRTKRAEMGTDRIPRPRPRWIGSRRGRTIAGCPLRHYCCQFPPCRRRRLPCQTLSQLIPWHRLATETAGGNNPQEPKCCRWRRRLRGGWWPDTARSAPTAGDARRAAPTTTCRMLSPVQSRPMLRWSPRLRRRRRRHRRYLGRRLGSCLLVVVGESIQSRHEMCRKMKE